MTHIIDGKSFAANLRQTIAKDVATLKAEHNLTPGLAQQRQADRRSGHELL